LNDRFTCVGAKAAIRRNAYRFSLYQELGSARSSVALARDLELFAHEQRSIESEFTTFVASFTEPAVVDEVAFEQRLWRTLQHLHDADATRHAWDASVSADPSDPHFGFSFATTAFFIVGLHAGSSRVTRRFAWPTLVFNPHQQFEQLKHSEHYTRFQRVIRAGETALQGGINPMLAEFGDRSEASQYSGRRVDAAWKCPFHPHTTSPAAPGEDAE
jgi:FPC/CPF motif-containing protein YcgG